LGQRFLIEQRKFNANGFSCGGASALTHFHFLMARPTTGELDADVQRILSNYLPENTCINVLQELQHVCVATMRRKIAPLWGGGGHELAVQDANTPATETPHPRPLTFNNISHFEHRSNEASLINIILANNI
jgi:hypothetical protein